MKKNHFNITVCENPKFIWFRNAKVATRSIKWVIDQQFETQEFHVKNIKPYDLSEYFTFGLVRNPYTRILSAFFNKVVQSFDKKQSELKKWHHQYLKHFPDYEQLSVEGAFQILLKELTNTNSQLYKNRHFTPQSRLIDPNRLDFLGRFEHLNEDTDFIFQKIGAQYPLPHKHKNSSSERNPSKFLDPKNRKIIEEIYQQVFKLFNYPTDV